VVNLKGHRAARAPARLLVRAAAVPRGGPGRAGRRLRRRKSRPLLL